MVKMAGKSEVSLLFLYPVVFMLFGICLVCGMMDTGWQGRHNINQSNNLSTRVKEASSAH